jgi:hypothetical protein
MSLAVADLQGANRVGVKIPHQSSIEVCRPQSEQHSATGIHSVLGFL